MASQSHFIDFNSSWTLIILYFTSSPADTEKFEFWKIKFQYQINCTVRCCIVPIRVRYIVTVTPLLLLLAIEHRAYASGVQHLGLYLPASFTETMSVAPFMLSWLQIQYQWWFLWSQQKYQEANLKYRFIWSACKRLLNVVDGRTR